MSRLGIVAIGRNEGERLRRCLESVAGLGHAVVYVDSGSTDGSVERARALGAEVVELDLSVPFTAARARNAGFERLERVAPGVELVQFVDGDCEVAPGWLTRACTVLAERPDVAVVAGRRRERHRDETRYNRLADLEWDTPIGEADACGGDAMIRAEAFRRAGGYDPTIIAGEEPELCLRIRRAGWKVLRIDAEMTVHDMAMTRFAQWWRREVRNGHADAEAAARHGRGPERHSRRETRSVLFWGVGVPTATAILAWPTGGLSLALLAGYPALFVKTERYYRRIRGWPAPDARLYAAACVAGKFPRAIGLARYWAGRIGRRPSRIIEYRGAEPGAPPQRGRGEARPGAGAASPVAPTP
jgi:GT2 family glycosyltransferase